ncbi:hypothetical protein TRIATDRAFT_87396 [Trichoderma atroviride IMI 206040]|uniref:Uncharacterized protein n=1 Tax=Hypocrea atroviridis (strain ATCC 20476 / IMI 206040) TaxID=452589 RepID=G9NY17_HYPAI|nr:uncharacterized protein TRIATDRAFT_87396 [Trichoderma atroviride IMI 206040]EHK44345.1 hypothetical protein TRIATDRAFT_87396 [Trichoderma atroviride IMI 206040]
MTRLVLSCLVSTCPVTRAQLLPHSVYRMLDSMPIRQSQASILTGRHSGPACGSRRIGRVPGTFGHASPLKPPLDDQFAFMLMMPDCYWQEQELACVLPCSSNTPAPYMPTPAHALFPSFCNSYIGARLASASSQPGFSGRWPDRTIEQLTAAHAPASKLWSRSARIDPPSTRTLLLTGGRSLAQRRWPGSGHTIWRLAVGDSSGCQRLGCPLGAAYGAWKLCAADPEPGPGGEGF